MICTTDKLNTAINTTCQPVFGMENNGYITLRSGLVGKTLTDFVVSFTPSEAVIPVFHSLDNLAYKPKSEGTINAYGLAKFEKSIEIFILENTPLTERQVMQLKNEQSEWVFVGKQKDGQNVVFGYERGLRVKTYSQEQSSTETHGGIVLTLDENYVNAPMLFCSDAVYDWIDYEVITGLTIALNGQISVEVDSDKSAMVILSDGTILNSIDGIINDTADVAGEVIIKFDKNTSDFNIGSSGTVGVASEFAGVLNTNIVNIVSLAECNSITEVNALFASTLAAVGSTSLETVSAPLAIYLYCDGCTSLTSISAPLATIWNSHTCTSLTSISAPSTTQIYCHNSTSLETISCPESIFIKADGCALNIASVKKVLDDAYTLLLATPLLVLTIDLSGGTNAEIDLSNGSIIHDATYADLVGAILLAGGTCVLNEST